MSSLLLTDAERARFAAYLEQDAHSTEQIVEQMKLLGGPLEPLIRERKAEAAAARIIAARLRQTESA